VGCGSQGIAQNFQTGAPLADEQMWATGQTSPGHAGAPDMNERTSSCEDVARRAETHHFNLLYPGSRHREEYAGSQAHLLSLYGVWLRDFRAYRGNCVFCASPGEADLAGVLVKNLREACPVPGKRIKK